MTSISLKAKSCFYLRRILAFIIVLAVVLLVHQTRAFRLPRSTKASTVRVRIDGQWKHVRRSLMLPSLQDEIGFEHEHASLPPQSLTSSSFFRFKRRALEGTAEIPREKRVELLPELYFAEDAMQEKRLSYEELRETFPATHARRRGTSPRERWAT
ncbi:hypothetical protein E1B28_002486 [Marasmius oreades]|uniref:Uncharacterized protein n=1 Tax=Marasmius oreades TaxID=181124 RepID=A0A9P7RN39_9AGAR|nr:uncharacterized protein E1B28_002486 [Marasmius oreades]KAG7086535.1 hypothetical protein E1B28_002486 [Marasmius oreades]